MHLSYNTGEVVEARQLTETRVSGGGKNSAVSTSVRHMTNCRVSWSDGSVSFHKFGIDCSQGDNVALVFADGKVRAEVNRTTGQSHVIDTSLTATELTLAVVAVPLMLVMMIGVLLFGYVLYSYFKRRNEQREELQAYIASQGLGISGAS